MRWLVTLVLFSVTLLAGCGGGASSSGTNSGNNNNNGSNNTPPPPTTWTAHGLTIPIAHPRIWWNATLLAQAKTWATANPSKLPSLPSSPQPEDYISLAWEHVVTGADCTPAVNWASNTDQSNRVNGWPPSAGQTTTTANGSDTLRDAGEAAIIVYDWCNDQWSASQKAGFTTAMNTWIATVDQQAYPAKDAAEDNYFLGNMRNDFDWGIASYGDNGNGPGSAADNFLVEALTRWTAYQTAFASDNGGVPGEGSEYGSAETYMDIDYQTLKNEGLDIASQLNRPKANLFYLIYGSTPAPTLDSVDGVTAFQLFSFGDDEHFPDDGGILYSRLYWQDHLSWATNVLSGTGVSKDARLLYNNWMADSQTKQPTDLMFAAQDSKPAAASDFSALPLDYVDNYMHLGFIRTAWDTSSTVAMLQMGHGGAGAVHQHWDWGSFTLWRGGRYVDRESAGYDNTIAGTPGIDNDAPVNSTSQLAHNSLVFTNVALGQDSKLTYTVPSAQLGDSVIHRMASQPSYFYADVDLTPVYLWGADHSRLDTGVVGHVEREFIYVRPLETLVVFDRVLTQNQTHDGSLTAGQVVTSFLNHCETMPVATNSTSFTCTDGDQVAQQSVLLPVAPTARIINENTGGTLSYDGTGPTGTSTGSCTACSGNAQYRVEVDNSGAAQRYDLDVIQARALTGPAVTASVVDSNPGDPSSGTFTLTLQPATGQPTVIVFQKAACTAGAGQCSTGGTINVAGAGAAPLRTDVQTMSYSDDGPVWGK